MAGADLGPSPGKGSTSEVVFLAQLGDAIDVFLRRNLVGYDYVEDAEIGEERRAHLSEFRGIRQ